MGADEEGTLSRLKAHRRELVDPAINGFLIVRRLSPFEPARKIGLTVLY